MHNDITLEQALRSVGEGWSVLVRELYAALPEDVYVVQVKEKFGGLRFYWDVLHDARNPTRATRPGIRDFEELVAHAERRSLVTCENCGAPGTPQAMSWIRTLCAPCAATDQWRTDPDAE